MFECKRWNGLIWSIWRNVSSPTIHLKLENIARARRFVLATHLKWNGRFRCIERQFSVCVSLVNHYNYALIIPSQITTNSLVPLTCSHWNSFPSKKFFNWSKQFTRSLERFVIIKEHTKNMRERVKHDGKLNLADWIFDLNQLELGRVIIQTFIPIVNEYTIKFHCNRWKFAIENFCWWWIRVSGGCGVHSFPSMKPALYG